MDSIDHVLASLGKTDPSTGKTISADDVFADWVVASYIHDGKVADGRYTYHNYPQAPKPSDTETVRSCPLGAVQRDVSQYGVDYIHVTCTGDYQIHFQAPAQVGLMPVQPHSGSYAFFSNRGDESDMTLTRTFDFTNSTGPLTFSYWTWYDIEKDYDYAYLTASLDGEHWQILTTPSGTNKNPSGNSYGWGYNDKSGGGPAWIQEHVDISQFTGKKVQLRFEYITDAAVNGEGFLLDDLSVPEAGYTTDLEKDDGGWVGSGFVRVQNILPQTFRVTLISKGLATTVKDIQLDESNAADIPIHLGGDVKDVVMVVSGTTRFTLQKAVYQFSIQSLP
jgi:immune inhibitor A